VADAEALRAESIGELTTPFFEHLGGSLLAGMRGDDGVPYFDLVRLGRGADKIWPQRVHDALLFGHASSQILGVQRGLLRCGLELLVANRLGKLFGLVDG